MTRDDQIELGETGGLAYRSAGAGRPLVVRHPGPRLDGSVWPVVARWLQESPAD